MLPYQTNKDVCFLFLGEALRTIVRMERTFTVVSAVFFYYTMQVDFFILQNPPAVFGAQKGLPGHDLNQWRNSPQQFYS